MSHYSLARPATWEEVKYIDFDSPQSAIFNSTYYFSTERLELVIWPLDGVKLKEKAKVHQQSQIENNSQEYHPTLAIRVSSYMLV
jgi:hypothetical protein